MSDEAREQAWAEYAEMNGVHFHSIDRDTFLAGYDAALRARPRPSRGDAAEARMALRRAEAELIYDGHSETAERVGAVLTLMGELDSILKTP